MEKIYNNLSIENLIRTEWFNQFNEEQKKEIIKGLKKGLDISWYAKKEFTDEQMNKIRTGLEDNIDVSIYAKPEYTWEQMNIILEGLKANVNISLFADPDIDLFHMTQIFYNLIKERKNNEKNI